VELKVQLIEPNIRNFTAA